MWTHNAEADTLTERGTWETEKQSTDTHIHTCMRALACVRGRQTDKVTPIGHQLLLLGRHLLLHNVDVNAADIQQNTRYAFTFVLLSPEYLAYAAY